MMNLLSKLQCLNLSNSHPFCFFNTQNSEKISSLAATIKAELVNCCRQTNPDIEPIEQNGFILKKGEEKYLLNFFTVLISVQRTIASELTEFI